MPSALFLCGVASRFSICQTVSFKELIKRREEVAERRGISCFQRQGERRAAGLMTLIRMASPVRLPPYSVGSAFAGYGQFADDISKR